MCEKQGPGCHFRCAPNKGAVIFDPPWTSNKTWNDEVPQKAQRKWETIFHFYITPRKNWIIRVIRSGGGNRRRRLESGGNGRVTPKCSSLSLSLKKELIGWRSRDWTASISMPNHWSVHVLWISFSKRPELLTVLVRLVIRTELFLL